jgi:hypothetical protein
MEFKLIKSKDQYKKHLSLFKKNNLACSIIRENPNSPEEYPCLCYTYIKNDMNGLGPKSIFVYKKDFKLFSNSRDKV